MDVDTEWDDVLLCNGFAWLIFLHTCVQGKDGNQNWPKFPLHEWPTSAAESCHTALSQLQTHLFWCKCIYLYLILLFFLHRVQLSTCYRSLSMCTARFLVSPFCRLLFWGRASSNITQPHSAIKPSIASSHLHTSTLLSAHRSFVLLSVSSVQGIKPSEWLPCLSADGLQSPPLPFGVTRKVTVSNEISACASPESRIISLLKTHGVKDRSSLILATIVLVNNVWLALCSLSPKLFFTNTIR